MKKILSIFMVAVLSLNLLYQPCEAMNNQQSAGNYQQQQWSDSHSQGEISWTRDLLNWAKIALKVSLFVACSVGVFYLGCVGGFISGYEKGWTEAIRAIEKNNPGVIPESHTYQSKFFFGPGVGEILKRLEEQQTTYV